MDAYHCPGAVMFYFKGKMGTVLHTGDFRFSEKMFNVESVFPMYKRNKELRAISADVDYLFLDNTFADPEYDFPSREEAYLGLKEIVKSHENHRIFAFSYYLGKEEVFVNLARDFNTQVSYLL
jgi:DNA cross-link repair 1B protein